MAVSNFSIAALLTLSSGWNPSCEMIELGRSDLDRWLDDAPSELCPESDVWSMGD
jgi:hypothetical protein